MEIPANAMVMSLAKQSSGRINEKALHKKLYS